MEVYLRRCDISKKDVIIILNHGHFMAKFTVDSMEVISGTLSWDFQPLFVSFRRDAFTCDESGCWTSTIFLQNTLRNKSNCTAIHLMDAEPSSGPAKKLEEPNGVPN
jgi:hypothetical protein